MQAMPLCWMKKGPLKTPLAYEYQAKMHVYTLANQLSIYFICIFIFFCFNAYLSLLATPECDLVILVHDNHQSLPLKLLHTGG